MYVILNEINTREHELVIQMEPLPVQELPESLLILILGPPNFFNPVALDIVCIGAYVDCGSSQ